MNSREKRAIVHSQHPAGPRHPGARFGPALALAAVRRVERALFILGGALALIWVTIAAGMIAQRLAPPPPLQLKIDVESDGVPIPEGPRPGSTPPNRALAV